MSLIFRVKEVHPLHDYVLVKRCELNKTPSGLHVIQESPSNLAIIVAVGPGREGVQGTKPMVKPGDKVLIDKWIGTKVILDEVEHTLIKWYDCQASIILIDE